MKLSAFTVLTALSTAAATALSTAPQLAAQEQSRDTARIAPVIVSATRTELPQNALPVAVTVITAADMRLRGITTVAEALRDLTSAYVAQSGSQGSQTSLFLRGGESKYVKVLVDDVPVNDPGGFYDFSSLTTDNVERIEVVRGPVSVVHGADAVTGVVHVITKSGRGSPGGSIEVRAGTAPRTSIAGSDPGPTNSLDVDAQASGALAGSNYSFGLARHETNGLYEQNNKYYNNVASGRLQMRLDASTDARVSLRYNDYRFNFPTNGGGNVVDANSHRTEDRMIVGAELTRALAAGSRTTLRLNSSVNDGVSDNPMDAPGGSSSLIQDKTRRYSAELLVSFLTLENVSATIGAQVEQQKHRQELHSQSSFGPFDSDFSAKRRNSGLYAEAVLRPSERLTATLGSRMDDNEAFGRFATHRVAASLQASPATRVRFTAGNAFREPTFLENYASGFATGNPGLTPERTFSVDGGVDQQFLNGRIEAGVTGFSQRFKNMIDYDPSDSCGFSYCNIAEATSKGVEADVRGRLLPSVWASAGATFLKTKVVTPGFDQTSGGLYRAGEPLIRRPERKISAELSYRGSRPLSASLRATSVGIRRDKDFRTFPSTPVILPSYTRFDLGAEYALTAIGATRPVIVLRVENLTDERYQNVFNFLTPRRTVSTGVRAVF